MNALWQWFLGHGDKLLTALAAVALTPGLSLPVWVPALLGALATAHILGLPEPSPPTVQPPVNKQAGHTRLAFIAFTIAILAPLAIYVTACKTTPTATQQAGIAVAVDIAVGLAVQQGSNDPTVWKSRATQFENAAKAIAAVNAAGATSLQTLMADLQPFIAKLGPADVLAANALVAALSPIIASQLGTNPTLATTQKDIAAVLQDIITACSAYTGS